LVEDDLYFPFPCRKEPKKALRSHSILSQIKSHFIIYLPPIKHLLQTQTHSILTNVFEEIADKKWTLAMDIEMEASETKKEWNWSLPEGKQSVGCE